MDLTKFWRDFYIPIQEEKKDFPIANISDVASSLIRSRNWMGTFTEEVVRLAKEINETKAVLRRVENFLLDKEARVVAESLPKLTATVVKNKDILKLHIRKFASESIRGDIDALETQILEIKNKLEYLVQEKENIERIMKTLERGIEWSIQYINWQKFELRTLNE